MANPNEIKQQVGGMSHEQLVELIKEIRKPVKSEREIRDEQQAAIDREQMGKSLEQGRKNRLADQAACPHKRKDGSTSCVYIDQPVFKLYCQICGAWIGPDHSHYNELYALTLD